jgi:hypothetical protein
MTRRSSFTALRFCIWASRDDETLRMAGRHAFSDEVCHGSAAACVMGASETCTARGRDHQPGRVLQAGFAPIRTQEVPRQHAVLPSSFVGLRQDLGVDREGV